MYFFSLILELSEYCCAIRITKNLLSLSIPSMYFVLLTVFSLSNLSVCQNPRYTIRYTLRSLSRSIPREILVKYLWEEVEHQNKDDGTHLNYFGAFAGLFSDCLQKGGESFREANSPFQAEYREFWRKRFLWLHRASQGKVASLIHFQYIFNYFELFRWLEQDST